MPQPRTWSDQQLTEAVRTTTSIRMVCFALRLKCTGGQYSSLKKHIERLALDTSHFKNGNGGKNRLSDAAWCKRNLRVRTTKLQGSRLRQRLVGAGLKQERCEHCGLTSWNGDPPPLQVDHENGNPLDCRLKNLRMLCANCHQQTETWGRKLRTY